MHTRTHAHTHTRTHAHTHTRTHAHTHTRTHACTGQSKEGFSVLGVLDRCVTPGGHRLMRLWMAQPPLDLGRLEARLDGVEFFMGRGDAAAALW